MRKLSLNLIACLLIATAGFSQDKALKEAVTQVEETIDDQTPVLEGFSGQLEVHRAELEERKIVLKYHKGNKEVSTSINDAVARIEEFNEQARDEVSKFESVWYDMMPNIIIIYTRYGELREATGGGSTELDKFVESHSDYMKLMSGVRTDIEYIAADCGYLRQ